MPRRRSREFGLLLGTEFGCSIQRKSDPPSVPAEPLGVLRKLAAERLGEWPSRADWRPIVTVVAPGATVGLYLGPRKAGSLTAVLQRDPALVICKNMMIPRGFKAILGGSGVESVDRNSGSAGSEELQALSFEATQATTQATAIAAAAPVSSAPLARGGSYLGADTGSKARAAGNPGGVVSDAATYKDSLGA